MRHHPTWISACFLGLCVTQAWGQARPPPGIEDSRAAFGAFSAPAALPPGSTAAYGFIGVPEVGAGFRQGLDGMELDARAKLDWMTLALTAEVLGKFPALRTDALQLAPLIGVGVVFNTGATYIDSANFAYVGVRLTPGANLSYRVAETVSLIGELAVPVDITLSPRGGTHVRPLVGGGAEFYLGEDLTAGAVAQVGADVIKQPQGVAETRFAFAFRAGIGWRFF